MTIRERLYRLGECLLFITGVMAATDLVLLLLGKSGDPPYYLAFMFVAGLVLVRVDDSTLDPQEDLSYLPPRSVSHDGMGDRPTMQFKTYSNEQSAKRALRKGGLQALPVEFEPVHESGRDRVRPVVQCELAEDAREAQSRGFKAKVSGAPAA